MSLLQATEDGLYCAAGGFHVDPWRPVDRAIITHAHSDHARPGSHAYLTSAEGTEVLRQRVGDDGGSVDGLAYGRSRRIGDALVSLHPAGHCLGACQVRVEAAGEVWVVSGDYRLHADDTCTPFEAVACDVFVTESTFGLPVFRWPEPERVFADMNGWWQANREAGRSSLLCAYALGKAQRVLGGIDRTIGPIYAHGAVRRFVDVYRAAGIDLPEVRAPDEEARRAGGLIVAPPSALGSGWLRRFGDLSTAFVSGWMQLRGTRRRRNVERGFVLSDHADWSGLLDAVAATGAGRVIATHGFSETLARYLEERGLETGVWSTRYEGEQADADAAETTDTVGAP